jgi:hypothetical protein
LSLSPYLACICMYVFYFSESLFYYLCQSLSGNPNVSLSPFFTSSPSSVLILSMYQGVYLSLCYLYYCLSLFLSFHLLCSICRVAWISNYTKIIAFHTKLKPTKHRKHERVWKLVFYFRILIILRFVTFQFFPQKNVSLQ